MATNDDYLKLRRMTGEQDGDKYTNTDLDIFISEANGDLNLAASAIWAEKASDYADLVNQSEAGSSRSNSDLFKHAADQRDHFLSIATTTVAATPTGPTTRRIVRA
jgi:hypothetical protein